jgi:hypothetical protein
MSERENSSEDRWLHDPRGLTHLDFFRLLGDEPTRAEKANITRVRGAVVQIALKEGGFTRDPAGSFISRGTIENVVGRLHAGDKLFGLKDQSLKMLEQLLSTSAPLESDNQGFAEPAEETR